MREMGALRMAALVAVLVLITAACDDTGTTAASATTTTQAPDLGVADFNGDGKVLIGVATDGARDDGAYYQALVEKVEQLSADNGYEDPIIVDLIDPADAATELENIAQQNPDIIAVGSSALGEPLPDLVQEYDDIFWYCNCGSGYQDTPGLLRSSDSGAELQLSAGYATGLLLAETGGDGVVFLGCCDLDFEVESFLAFELGLSLVDESFEATYVPTGNSPYDFHNTPGATEAYFNAVAEGADAVVPFLGGAHEPIVQLANDDGLIVMTAGSSKGCERDDLDYDLEVRFDAGDYLTPIFDEILAGAIGEGGAREFHVGIDPEVGAEFCDATAEQVEALDLFNKSIGVGAYSEEILAIMSAAYGF